MTKNKNNWLLEYTLWYYQSYRVSINKLKLKVKNKFWEDFDENLFEKVSLEIKDYIDEKEDIQNIILWYKYKNKSIFYIKWKLFERMYEWDLITKMISENIDEFYEEEALRVLFSRFTKEEIKKRKQKIINSFTQKGFNYSIINDAILNL